jgi:sugar O-acyltransferase (sialic acid O-acetyltransferase NeuD family)
MKKKLIIFGNGEIADIAFFYFKNENKYKIEAFCMDKEFIQDTKFNNLPVIPFDGIEKKYTPKEYYFHLALSYQKLNMIREKKFNEIQNKKYNFASYISKKSFISPNISKLGKNLFILENQTIQNNVQINDNVMLWSGNHVGHGSIINSHTYISSHVVISGHCLIGKRCFLGVNSSIADFCNIGDDCFIGMGSHISSNLKSGSTTVSKNTEIFLEDNRIGKFLKKKFFKF